MARFHYDIAAAGVPAGVEKLLPEGLAAELVSLGIGHIVEEADSAASNPEDEKTPGEPAKAVKSPQKRARKTSK